MKPYNGKRILDLVVAGTACMAFAPVVTALAIAVCLEDGGPAVFSQSRVGRGRRPFTILKLRSMRDDKVTRVGNWLRRTGIDELPQFINVCRGDMSIVGPRPLTAHDVERLGWSDVRHDWRFAAKPGITGLSQLLPGGGARASERLDRLYLARQSALLDLELITLSFAVNLFGKRTVREFMRTRRAARRLRTQSRDAAASTSLSPS